MPLVEVCDLTKHYGDVAAVERVTFAIEEGETFGLVGESGSGKSTTGRCLLRLIEPTSGEVRFRGENVLALDRVRLRQIRREMQMVFQDPFSSLNPRMRVGDIVREPLDIHGIGSRAERRRRVEERISSACPMRSAAGSGSASASHARSRCRPPSSSPTSRCRLWICRFRRKSSTC
jgi:ABC-type glutathione transport system ATPase component